MFCFCDKQTADKQPTERWRDNLEEEGFVSTLSGFISTLRNVEEMLLVLKVHRWQFRHSPPMRRSPVSTAVQQSRPNNQTHQRIQALWNLSNFLMVHEGFFADSPQKYFLKNWFPITKYGVSISFSQQAFLVGASLHCRQSDERNTFSNGQSRAKTSGVREHIYFRVYKESTNDASE